MTKKNPSFKTIKLLFNNLKKTSMAYTGQEDHDIDLQTASRWNKNFRDTIPTSAADQTTGHFFGKDYIQSILDQTDCVGIRVYYALDDDGLREMIICGAKANEDDLYNGILAERAKKSPPGGASNPLNS
jgi:hypothetical protein